MNRAGIILAGACLFFSASCFTSSPEAPDAPKYVILFIGDGMGPEQVRAGAYLLGRPLSFEAFPVHTSVATSNASGGVTDSAAAATAIATGRKVDNGVLSLAIPGSGEALETLLERAARGDRATGLATTVTVTHATPAAFGAHQTSRYFYDAIAADYLNWSRPNVLLGGGGTANGLDDAEAAAAGYAVVKTLAELSALGAGTEHAAGLFGDGFLRWEADGGPHLDSHPDLADMTAQALRLLERDEEGFFLLVESGLIDQAAHAQNAELMVWEVAALDRAVTAALAWAVGKDSVLIVVTADHETGGISEVVDAGTGNTPTVAFTTAGHSGIPVDLFARGYRAERLGSVRDNTEIRAAIYE